MKSIPVYCLRAEGAFDRLIGILKCSLWALLLRNADPQPNSVSPGADEMPFACPALPQWRSPKPTTGHPALRRWRWGLCWRAARSCWACATWRPWWTCCALACRSGRTSACRRAAKAMSLLCASRATHPLRGVGLGLWRSLTNVLHCLCVLGRQRAGMMRTGSALASLPQCTSLQGHSLWLVVDLCACAGAANGCAGGGVDARTAQAAIMQPLCICSVVSCSADCCLITL